MKSTLCIVQAIAIIGIAVTFVFRPIRIQALFTIHPLFMNSMFQNNFLKLKMNDFKQILFVTDLFCRIYVFFVLNDLEGNQFIRIFRNIYLASSAFIAIPLILLTGGIMFKPEINMSSKRNDSIIYISYCVYFLSFGIYVRYILSIL